MSTLELTLDWRTYVDDIPAEIQERQTQNLYLALRQLPEIERIARVPDPNVPDGGMGAAWLTDLLLTEVFPGGLGSIFNLIRQRLPGTPIDVEIEVGDRRIVLKGIRPKDFDAVVNKIQQTINDMSGK